MISLTTNTPPSFNDLLDAVGALPDDHLGKQIAVQQYVKNGGENLGKAQLTMPASKVQPRYFAAGAAVPSKNKWVEGLDYSRDDGIVINGKLVRWLYPTYREQKYGVQSAKPYSPNKQIRANRTREIVRVVVDLTNADPKKAVSLQEVVKAIMDDDAALAHFHLRKRYGNIPSETQVRNSIKRSLAELEETLRLADIPSPLLGGIHKSRVVGINPEFVDYVLQARTPASR